MSHKKIIKGALKKLEKDEKHYKAEEKSASPKKKHHLEKEVKEVKSAEKSFRKFAKGKE